MAKTVKAKFAKGVFQPLEPVRGIKENQEVEVKIPDTKGSAFFPVVLTPDEEDGGYVVECPIVPGCISEGDTEEEALENIKEAIIGCLEVRRERGLPLTVPLQKICVNLR